MPYISSSQEAVFEIRNKETAKKIGRQTNPYIAEPKVEETASEISEEDQLNIKPVWQPPQLKSIYSIIPKVEFEIDEDDEDALILERQPYETVMNVGFENLLTHINTKFLARRSDIIVSSTLSITLTPADGDYVPKKHAQISEDEA